MLIAVKENEEILLDVHQKTFNPDSLDKGRPANDTHEADHFIDIENHYGKYRYNLDKVIYFPKGMFGLERCHKFALRMLSSGRKHYYLLQNLEVAAISFLVMPLLLDAGDGIALDDALKACEDLEIKNSNEAYFLGILSMDNDGVKLNLRAPIIVDCTSKTAWQYIYHHGKYKVDHLLLE